MPELPEVEIVKRSLNQKISKSRILNIKIYNKKLRYKLTNSFIQDLVGEKIIKISRRSKYLIFYFSKKILLAHLGMTGKFLIKKSSNKKLFKTSFYYDLNILPKHNHVYFQLSNGLVLIYNDVRRFGFFKIYNSKKLSNITFLKKLGLEPFNKNFNENYFSSYIVDKKKNIKNLLMDQTFISGLGNIYVNEALFLSRVKPMRTCNSLKKREIIELIKNIKKILKISISKGGSSIKNFQSASGESGNFQQFFYVYGLNNKKCSRFSCNGKIKKIFICNRSSFYCSKCQK